MKKLVIAALLTATLGALAETTNTVPETTNTVPKIPVVIVTATRTAAPIRSVANNPTVISAEDIETGHYSSVPEALQKKAGVFVSNYADNPSQSQVNLRGFGENAHGRTLVLLNGRKLNRPDMAGINWSQIPMQAVERIEVIRGPNSVLYGDHAVGGVINIITKEPSEIPKTTLMASAGSDKKFEQNMVTSGSLDGLGYVASAGHQSGDGYRDRSRYDILSQSLRLSGNINEYLKAYAEVSAVQEQHQLPGALGVNQDRTSSNNPNDAAREEYLNFQTGAEALLTDELIFNLDGGVSQKNIEADFPSYAYPLFSIPPVYYDYKIDTYTLSPKLTVLTPLGDMDNELLLGVDLAKEALNTQKFNEKSRTVEISDTKVNKQTVGGYIADTLSLTDQLLLSGGYRLEENKVGAHQKDPISTVYDEDITHREDAWQTALTWLPTDQLKLFAGVDRTYRYPFVDEQAIYSGWGDAFNKDLKPETGINYEAGVEITPTSNTVLQATVFRTDMEDEIAWGAGKSENLDETTHRGVELSAVYTREVFEVSTYYTWMQSEFTQGDNAGNEMPWVPQNQLDLNLALFLTEAMTLNTHMSYIGSMFQSGDNTNSGDNQQSEYALFDLLLEHKIPIQKVDATVFAGIDNLFETEYNYMVGWGGYYPAPERTYKAGLSITF